MAKTIGERIREQRQSKFMEVEELADLVSRHKNTIYNYECGYKKPSRKAVKLIAAALKCKPSDLWVDEV